MLSSLWMIRRYRQAQKQTWYSIFCTSGGCTTTDGQLQKMGVSLTLISK